MEDIIKTLLDVVRAQHSAAEGTETEPFNMDDVVDMALGVMGRPEEPEEEAQMVESIQKMVESLAPDIFPPKTFEQMDDEERAASAVSMIEARLLNGFTGRKQDGASSGEREAASGAVPDSGTAPVQEENKDTVHEESGRRREMLEEQKEGQQDAVSDNIPPRPEADEGPSDDGGPSGDSSDEFDAGQAADLNDMIYKNLMQMMGLQDPKVEFPFDRSKVRYGREKSVTEQLEEEKQQGSEKEKQAEEPRRQISAWELAQDAVGKDEAAHEKEPYVPKPLEMPETKSASQLAAEAIARSQEEDKMKLEIEKRAEELMAEARKQGKDPMQFALCQQEILRYMEKNRGEMVSFEDYENLSPEEKNEIERQIQIEKQTEAGTDPEEAGDTAPEEYIPGERSGSSAGEETPDQPDGGIGEESDERPAAQAAPPVFTEEMLRQLSQEVIRENSEMILADNEDEDMESLNEAIFANIQKMMSGSGQAVPQENVDELIRQAEDSQLGSQIPISAPPTEPDDAVGDGREAGEPGEAFTEDDFNLDEMEPGDPEDDISEENAGAAEISRDTKADADYPDSILKKKDGTPADESEPEAAERETEPEGTEPEKEPEETEEEPEEKADPNELALGSHTQAEVDEAMNNLADLGLEGDVYERAKRMLLLELAGSEAALEAWLREQENGKKNKTPSSSGNKTDLDDMAEIDEEALEKELEQAMDEDFLIDDESEEMDELPADGEEPEEGDGLPMDGGEEPEGEDESATEEGEPEKGDGLPMDGGEEPEGEDESPADGEKSGGEDESPAGMVKPGAEERPFRVQQKAARSKKKTIRKKEKTPLWKEKAGGAMPPENAPEEKGYQVSVRRPFLLKNSASYMDQFEEYIADAQENRRLSTGFKKLDGMLRYGLHKGSYFIDAEPQYLKNSFMQQIADRAAEEGIDVLYISTELSRYDLMLDTISRLSYEIHQGDPDKAVSVMAIMTGEDGADLASLKDELNWYRGRISEHLFILDQEAVSEYADSMDDSSGGDILSELIRSIVREGAHKPVVFIDNIENILSTEDSEDMKPLMEAIRRLARELGIPIVMSYGYAQAESVEEMYPEEKEYHESLGNMCDVYMELRYADMITEESAELTGEDIREMVEEGESLLIDVHLHKNRRPMKASCQIQGTPKYNYFEE